MELKVRAYRKTKPRGLSLLVREPENEIANFYIHEATYYEEQLLARTYDLECNNVWCGFFALVNSTLKLDKADTGLQEVMERKKIPRTPPAILLAQLYICSSARNSGYGSQALRCAVELGLRSPGACRLVIVDLENESLKGFYAKHGWLSGPQTNKRMYLDLFLFKRIRNELRRAQPNISQEEELKYFAKVQSKLSEQRVLF